MKGLIITLISIFIGVSMCQVELNRLDCCPPNTYVVWSNNTFVCRNRTMGVREPVDFCSGTMFLSHLGSEGRYIVGLDNKLTIIMKYTNVTIPRKEYCLARLYKNNTFVRTPLICNHEETNKKLTKVNDYCKVVSVFFLLFTAILYASVKELRDTHGLSVINLCISLSIALGMFAGMNMTTYSDMTLCAVRGFSAYFFMIASFFWMTSLTIQMLLKIRNSVQNEKKMKNFVGYFAFSWGSATVLTFVVALINFLPSMDHNLRAGIGLNHCWFFDTNRQWMYMYSVMTTLIAMNSILYIYILIKLYSESTEEAPKGSKFTKAICVFIVSGLAWIVEVIPESQRCITTEILDLINTLQGVAIFIVLGLSVLFYQKKYKWNIWQEKYENDKSVVKSPVSYKNFA